MTMTQKEVLEGIVKKVHESSHLSTSIKTTTPRHTLIHVEEGHYKFYQLAVEKTTLYSCYGKIGAPGVISGVQYASAEDAINQMNAVLKAKLAKGYIEPLEYVSTATTRKKRSPVKLDAEGTAKLEAFLTTLK